MVTWFCSFNASFDSSYLIGTGGGCCVVPISLGLGSGAGLLGGRNSGPVGLDLGLDSGLTGLVGGHVGLIGLGVNVGSGLIGGDGSCVGLMSQVQVQV